MIMKMLVFYPSTILFIGLIAIFCDVKAKVEYKRNLLAPAEITDHTPTTPSIQSAYPYMKFHYTTQDILPISVPAAQEITAESDNSQERTLASRQLSELLSPDIFSKSDAFQYLLDETSKLRTSWELEDLITEVESRLKTNKFSKFYIPYAQTLRSILRGQFALLSTKWNIQRIRETQDRSNVPAEISNPPALSDTGLFSTYIFSEPDPVTRLINKLLVIPKKNIPNLITQLQNFSSVSKTWINAPTINLRYVWHAQNLSIFLQKNSSILDDLKCNMDKLKRISSIIRQRSGNIDLSSKSQEPAN